MKHRRITPEEIGLLDSLVKCAGSEKGADETILEIMEEEAAYLLDGSKTAEKTAEVIQNRVQLFHINSLKKGKNTWLYEGGN